MERICKALYMLGPVSVYHTSVLHRNGWTSRSDFRQRGYRRLIPHCVIREFGISKLPSVLCHCWWGVRKRCGLLKLSDEVLVWLSAWSEVQTICIWSGWCHHHPIMSCFIKIQNYVTFPVPACPGCPRKETVKRVVCLSVCLPVPPKIGKHCPKLWTRQFLWFFVTAHRPSQALSA